MPRSSETASLLGDYHRIGGVPTPRSTYGSGGGSSVGSAAATPRSPFDAGFPLLFSSPAPSPRPHRLSFAHTKDDAGRGAQVCVALLLSRHEEAMHIGAGKRFASFQTLAVAAGGKLFGYAVAAITALGAFGGCVGSIRIARDIAPFLTSKLYALAVGSSGAGLSAAASAQWADVFLCATFAVVVFPLCLLKNLSGLRLSSYLGFGFSLYVVAAIVYRSSHPLDAVSSADRSSSNDTAGLLGAGDALSAAGLSATSAFARFSQAVSLFNYAFMLHLNLLPLFVQLRGSFAEPLQKSRRKMSDYILGVTVFCVLLYVVVGLFARKLYGRAVRGNVLLNLERDPMMEIPLLAGFLTTLAGFPLLFQPLRSVIEELVYSADSGDVPLAARLGSTGALLLAQLLLALLVSGLEVVFIFTGATSCLLICYAFPAAMYTQLFPWRAVRGGKVWVVALWSVVAAFTVLGGVAVYSLLGRK
ncbi:hypothetical protein PybrP1_007578 [[Pythium] brassicae (nom. inval.)]|nr:hypothetical protein PybrP1_007578 [[Pythium] brassicae (nom. inval.)]